MPVDPSISLQAGQGQQNALTQSLTQYGQLANTLNSLNQNKLFQQQFQGQQAIGDAYQQATDPTTGVFDANKFAAIGSQDPRAAFVQPQIAQQALERQLQQQQVSSAEFDNVSKRVTSLQSRVAGLLAQKNVTIKDVAAAGGSWMAQMNSIPGHPTVPSSQVVKMMDGIDPNDVRGSLLKFNLTLQSAKDRLDYLAGTPQYVNNGQNQTPYAVSPITGVRQLGPSIPNQMTPAQAASPAPASPGPNGEQRQQTMQGFVNQNNGPAPAAPTPLSGTFRPALPGAPQPAAPSAGAQPPQASAAPGSGGIVTGLSPSRGIGMAAEAQASTDQFKRDSANNQTAPARIFMIQQAQRLLQDSDVTTGPTTDAFNKFKSGVLNLTGIGNAQTIGNYDQFKKYTTNYATQQAASFGHGTDQQLSAAFTGNPSASISTLANKDILRTNLALEKMQQAKLQAFQDARDGGQVKGPEDYNAWSRTWNKTADPRVFAFDQMSPAERNRMVNGMTPQQKQQFSTQLQSAVRGGFVTEPSAPSTPGG